MSPPPPLGGLFLPWLPDRFYINAIAAEEDGERDTDGPGRRGAAKAQHECGGTISIVPDEGGGSDAGSDGHGEHDNRDDAVAQYEVENTAVVSGRRCTVKPRTEGRTSETMQREHAVQTGHTERDERSGRHGGLCRRRRQAMDMRKRFSLARLVELVSGAGGRSGDEGWPGIEAAIFGTFSLDMRWVCRRFGRHAGSEHESDGEPFSVIYSFSQSVSQPASRSFAVLYNFSLFPVVSHESGANA